jgi:hypothetical protein
MSPLGDDESFTCQAPSVMMAPALGWLNVASPKGDALRFSDGNVPAAFLWVVLFDHRAKEKAQAQAWAS